MRLGGPAMFVVEAESKADIPSAFSFARSRNLPYYILGAGANTIAHDEGFPGVIIKNSIKGITEEETGLITIMGGTVWDEAVEYSCKKEYTGIEALSKIPGLAGAAPVQNIGAYGQEISQVLVSAEVYDINTGEFKTLSKDDFGFSYRKSILNTTEKHRYMVVSIKIQLKVGRMKRPFYNSLEKYIFDHNETVFTPENIRKIVSEVRASKLPDPAHIASSGSFFKNIYVREEDVYGLTQRGIPVHRGNDGIKINAGWLIEQAGFAGQYINGIRVNPNAALVLINENASSYNDLAYAKNLIVNAVFQKFGYRLEQEPEEIVDNSQLMNAMLNS